MFFQQTYPPFSVRTTICTPLEPSVLRLEHIFLFQAFTPHLC
nr:MAG TPA: hypothetical protein [Caudoviricetes sp.]